MWKILLFSLILFQIIPFFFVYLQAHFLVDQTFFDIFFFDILLLNISLDIFKCFLALERFVLCLCILLICINLFLNWFRLFFVYLSLSCNKLISLLILSISLFWAVFIYAWKKKFLNNFYGYHGKILWVFLCILFMVIIMHIYVHI